MFEIILLRLLVFIFPFIHLGISFKFFISNKSMVIVSFKQYYIAPSGRRLRSKNEVLNFLETGSKRKKPPTQSSEDTTSEGSAPRSKKKTTARKKVHAAFTFDFKSPPEKVSWRLTYASEDVWTPSIGDKNLPLATKQEWAAVFNHVCQN
ncbi:putative methyl-CpG DNA binding, DNA-binding domain superfamily [Helianthus annuus]|nr:putative methyl-CpG DNA binding, DNA-binding domain superfamily [Helianthus annuus]